MLFIKAAIRDYRILPGCSLGFPQVSHFQVQVGFQSSRVRWSSLLGFERLRVQGVGFRVSRFQSYRLPYDFVRLANF